MEKSRLKTTPFKSLYVHFPFCETKCHYCDFYSLGRAQTTEAKTTRFARALKAEWNLWDSRELSLNTIFFGGGTPSMTDVATMREIFGDTLKRSLTPGAEWTMEANPSSISQEHIAAARDFGVNRISMGVQSLDDKLLKWLGRVHSRDQAIRALNTVFESGISNVSTDLICGVPGQSTEDLNKAIRELTSFPISHLSCYLLTLPKSHAHFKDLPHEDVQLEHLMFIDHTMRELGFEHYEISNYAKPGREARHNLAYWTRKSYLGLGPSAHSFDADQKKRWKNFGTIEGYALALEKGESPVEWSETLTPEQEELESWLLGLRLSEGVPSHWFTQTPALESKRDQLLKEKLLTESSKDPNRFTLTPRGLALHDSVTQFLVSSTKT